MITGVLSGVNPRVDRAPQLLGLPDRREGCCAIMFVHFVTDVMLDIIWAERPHLPLEIHVSELTLILLINGSEPQTSLPHYRGARVRPSLESDHQVIIRERPSHISSPDSLWAYVGELRTGELVWHENCPSGCSCRPSPARS
jgi:hypothetical protein